MRTQHRDLHQPSFLKFIQDEPVIGPPKAKIWNKLKVFTGQTPFLSPNQQCRTIHTGTYQCHRRSSNDLILSDIPTDSWWKACHLHMMALNATVNYHLITMFILDQKVRQSTSLRYSVNSIG